LDLKISERF